MRACRVTTLKIAGGASTLRKAVPGNLKNLDNVYRSPTPSNTVSYSRTATAARRQNSEQQCGHAHDDANNEPARLVGLLGDGADGPAYCLRRPGDSDSLLRFLDYLRHRRRPGHRSSDRIAGVPSAARSALMCVGGQPGTGDYRQERGERDDASRSHVVGGSQLASVNTVGAMSSYLAPPQPRHRFAVLFSVSRVPAQQPFFFSNCPAQRPAVCDRCVRVHFWLHPLSVASPSFLYPPPAALRSLRSRRSRQPTAYRKRL